MTTIAYKGGVLAADSRCSDAYDMHLTNSQKLYRLDSGAILGAAGDDDARELMTLLGKAKTPKQLPSRADLGATRTEFSGILVLPNSDVFLITVCYVERTGEGEWTGAITKITDKMCSVGSGQQFAYGAMEAGASAPDAVRVACKRDTHSALPIQTLELPIKIKKVK